jgi:hypothetical protein
MSADQGTLVGAGGQNFPERHITQSADRGLLAADQGLIGTQKRPFCDERYR